MEYYVTHLNHLRDTLHCSLQPSRHLLIARRCTHHARADGQPLPVTRELKVLVVVPRLFPPLRPNSFRSALSHSYSESMIGAAMLNCGTLDFRLELSVFDSSL
jgi:hypothetical protein